MKIKQQKQIERYKAAHTPQWRNCSGMLQTQCSLFLIYALLLLEVGFPVLRLGEGGRWMVLQRMLNTCDWHVELNLKITFCLTKQQKDDSFRFSPITVFLQIHNSNFITDRAYNAPDANTGKHNLYGSKGSLEVRNTILVSLLTVQFIFSRFERVSEFAGKMDRKEKIKFSLLCVYRIRNINPIQSSTGKKTPIYSIKSNK